MTTVNTNETPIHVSCELVHANFKGLSIETTDEAVRNTINKFKTRPIDEIKHFYLESMKNMLKYSRDDLIKIHERAHKLSNPENDFEYQDWVDDVMICAVSRHVLSNGKILIPAIIPI